MSQLAGTTQVEASGDPEIAEGSDGLLAGPGGRPLYEMAEGPSLSLAIATRSAATRLRARFAALDQQRGGFEALNHFEVRRPPRPLFFADSSPEAPHEALDGYGHFPRPGSLVTLCFTLRRLAVKVPRLDGLP